MFPDHLEMLSMICCIFSKFIFFLWKISRSFWTIWFVCWRRTRFFSVRWKICRSSSTICFVSWLNRRSFCVSGSMFFVRMKKSGLGKEIYIEREKIRLTHLLSKKKKKMKKFISVKKNCTSCCLQVTRIRKFCNTLQCVCKSPMTLHEDRSTHGKYKYSKVFWRWKSLGTAIRDRSL